MRLTRLPTMLLCQRVKVLAINLKYLPYLNKFNLKVKYIPDKRTNTIEGYNLTTGILWSD